MSVAYFILAVSIILYSFQSISLKAYQKEAGQKIRQSLLLMFIANILMAVIFLCVNKFRLKFGIYTAVFGLIFAILNIGTNISFIKAIGAGSVSVATLFLLLGSVILPFIYGVGFLNEKLNMLKIIAVLILCLSFVPLLFEDKIKKISNWKYYIFCILSFCGNGLISVTEKMQQLYNNGNEIIEFLVFSSICTAVISAVIIIISKITNNKDTKLYISGKSLTSTACYGLCTGGGNLLLLYVLSLKKIPVSIQFPLVSGGIVILTSVLASLIYKDYLSKYRIGCLLLGVLSIILLSI